MISLLGDYLLHVVPVQFTLPKPNDVTNLNTYLILDAVTSFFLDLKTEVLHVENSCWDIYKFRLPFLEQMKEMGMRVILAAPMDEYFNKIDNSLYDDFIELTQLEPQKISPYKDLRFLLELKNILKKTQPDLALFFTIKPSIYGGLATQWIPTKAVCFLTGLGYSFYRQGLLKSIVGALGKVAFKKIQKLVVLNEDDQHQLLSLGLAKPDQLFVQPAEGVDTSHFYPLEKGEPNNRFTFLFIGRLIATKGLRELAKASEILKNRGRSFECRIVGDHAFANPSAISFNEINNWVKQGLVSYMGATDDVRQHIRNADVVVLPSHRAEGKPKVLQEAMAMAKPIITTQTPGCREMVVNGKNGVLVPHGNPAALADAMEFLMDVPLKQLEEMGKLSREIVEQRYATSVTKPIFKSLLSQVLPCAVKSYALPPRQVVKPPKYTSF